MSDELRRRLAFADSEAGREIIEIISREVCMIQADIFRGEPAINESLREAMGAIKFGVGLLKKIDPSYEFSMDFIQYMLIQAPEEEPAKVEEPERNDGIPVDPRTDRPKAF